MPKIRKVVKPGVRFSRLAVVEFAGRDKHSYRLWRCLCDCGSATVVLEHSLRSGATKSCGCYQAERTSQHNKIHGECRGYLYTLWGGIKQRCYDENDNGYCSYGGRGITLFESWRNDYALFASYIREHLGERPTEKHSLDRVDNEGDYEPGNLRWATSKEQTNNRRNNVLVAHEGETKTIAEWSEVTGIPYETIYARLHRNWTVRAALSQNFKEYREE